ncbi:MAG: 30S ribosomal protein S16 [Clostridiales Family XIII bacterium]|nr:30S ribosomal protein S16 [Clostridiales Family XIII bacterium]
MMVKIRLKRLGAKKKPFYRVVVADSRRSRDGKFIEEIGTFDPLTEDGTLKIKEDKVKDWISKGAKPTDTVRDLLRRNKII